MGPLALIPAGIGLAKAGFGLYQNIKGNRILNETERPTYQIPEEVMSNLTEAQKMALEGLPAEQKEAYLRNIDRGTANALSASASRKGGLAMVDNILKSQTDAYSTLLSQDATQRMQNKQALMAQRQNVANYRDKAFQYNQDEPYRQKLNEGQALVGSGLQNMFGGVSDAGSAVMSGLNNDALDNLASNYGSYKESKAPEKVEYNNTNESNSRKGNSKFTDEDVEDLLLMLKNRYRNSSKFTL